MCSQSRCLRLNQMTNTLLSCHLMVWVQPSAWRGWSAISQWLGINYHFHTTAAHCKAKSSSPIHISSKYNDRFLIGLKIQLSVIEKIHLCIPSLNKSINNHAEPVWSNHAVYEHMRVNEKQDSFFNCTFSYILFRWHKRPPTEWRWRQLLAVKWHTWNWLALSINTIQGCC